MPSEPIQRRKLSQAVLDRLLARIHSGEIPPGERLPSERELMEAYQVGRPAVREALQSLERSGIVNIHHGERARVARPSAESLLAQIGSGAQHLLRSDAKALEHLQQARVFLECGMARMAAGNATADHIEQLRLVAGVDRGAVKNPQQVVDGDMAFHRAIAAMSGNPIYPVVLEAMFRWMAEHYQSQVRGSVNAAQMQAEHARIVDAIEARDAQGAEQAMRDHLARAAH